MQQQMTSKKMMVLLSLGVVGCILMGTSDWLMIYGNTAFEGNLSWLTLGASQIPQWRNSLSMFLAFPAVIFYSAAFWAMAHYFPKKKHSNTYSALTALGMTPWLCLHLLYIMILHIFFWMTNHGANDIALPLCEEIFAHFRWMIPVSELLMLLPFFFLFYFILSGNSILARPMAINNPLIVYVILKGITLLMPDVPFRLAFVNGLMSESMLICFVIYMIYTAKRGMGQQNEITE